MLKSIKSKIAFGVAAASVLAANASAALTAPTISTTDYETIAGAVLVAAAVMWAIRKALGLLRA